ncbi:Laccase domain protein YfiH [Synechococcus sp. MIT S9509]|uniref:peptidoglycan editing factor PgeF n=1 Tax=Synechococcus sp. MIT S9509 TaxID=1801630 RepID=UPI0007BC2DE2|nr:peptidoglycan editing factor PgeF [Synechococcus sp. MIT S9509]KZR92934.1 Laccase domain protein YfiH [Synechococcus sp. MIT S9509]
MSSTQGADPAAGTESEDPLSHPDSRFNTLPGWTWVGCYGGYYLTADHLTHAGFEHGFFTRRWHGRGPDELAAYLSCGVSVHRPQQVHGNVVLEASAAAAAPWPDADGLVSDRGGQSLWVCGADCTPVLMADPDSGHVAACHAGWRGVASRILPAAIARLEQRGARRERLIVALGPAVSGERYQVEQSVALQVGEALAAEPRSLEELQRQAVLDPDPEQGRCRLDIRQAAVQQLKAEAIDSTRIRTCPLCTVAEPSLFHSWRRDQVKAVQWSGIVGQAAI